MDVVGIEHLFFGRKKTLFLVEHMELLVANNGAFAPPVKWLFHSWQLVGSYSRSQ